MKKLTSRNRTARAAKVIWCWWPRFTPIKCRPQRRKNILFKLGLGVCCYLLCCSNIRWWYRRNAVLRFATILVCVRSKWTNKPTLPSVWCLCNLFSLAIRWQMPPAMPYRERVTISPPFVWIDTKIPFPIAIKLYARSFWGRFPLDVALTDQQRWCKIMENKKHGGTLFFRCTIVRMQIYLFIHRILWTQCITLCTVMIRTADANNI